MGRRVWCFVALSLILDPVPAPAQEIPSLGEMIDVSIVNLEVFVTDRKGNRIRGLTADDFEVIENGVRKPLSNFAEYAAGVSTEPGPAETVVRSPLRSARQKRNVILFVDRFYLEPRQTKPLFAALRDLIRTTIAPGDSLMVVSWNRLLVMRLPLTQDMASAEEILAKIEKESVLRRRDFIPPIEEEREWLANAAAFAEERGFEIDSAEMLPLSGMEAATRARLQMRAKIRAINGLMQSVSGLEGRKALILVSHRFSRIAGREYLMAPGAMAGPRGRNDILFDMQEEISSVIRTANANGVTIYPLYPAGLGYDGGVSAERSRSSSGGAYQNLLLDNENEALTKVAHDTGGISEWGAEAIAKMLPRIREDFDSYYSMAYRIASTGSDRARSVTVKTRNGDYVVRSRTGYVEKSIKTRMSDRVLATLLRGAEGATIDLEVLVGQIREVGRKRYTIPLTVRIPLRSLMTLPQEREHAGAFSVFVGWANVLGEMGPVTEQRRAFRLTDEEKEGAAIGYHTHELEIAADGLTEKIAIGVLDEVSLEYGLARIELPPRQNMVLAKERKKNAHRMDR